MKCKQADLVSIYTSLCIEINKGRKGRDGEKKSSLSLCHRGRDRNVGPCVTGPFQLKIIKIQHPNNYIWNIHSCVRRGQGVIPYNKLLVWVWAATRRPGCATKRRDRCAGDEWHPPGGTEDSKELPTLCCWGPGVVGALSTIWLPAGMIYGVRKAR